MNIRKNTTWFLSLLILPLFIQCSQTKEEQKPNILFIMADDHTSQAISAYGTIFGDLFTTPNIDKLADQGMLFTNVFATNAICGPSRAAILTGKYAHVNGYCKNEKGGKFNASQWTFISEFKKQGYQTALFGKWHLGSEPEDFDYYKFHVGNGQQGNYIDPVYNDNGKHIKETGYATNLTSDFFLDWMKGLRKKDKPFAALLHFKAPHRPWIRDEKYKDLFDGVEMPYPSNFNDDYKGREKTAGDTWMTMDFLNHRDSKVTPPEGLEGKALSDWTYYGNKPNQAWMPEGCTTLEEARKWKYQQYIKDYLSCIKSVDDNVGRVLDYLEENGLAENTIVVYTGDQGFYLGEHGWFDKRFMYDTSSKMPFIVRYPKEVNKKSRNKDIITNVDFAPTLLDLANIEIPADVQGHSFAQNLKGNTPNDWKQCMYYQYYEYPKWHHVQPHYGIRNQRYKLIHFYYNIDVWEFYDLEKDPQEMNNAINMPEYQNIITEMKAEIVVQQKDLGINGSLEAMRAITDADMGEVE
ncbi:sulfatase family protein [Labilibaculum antarcticum]|uniref:Sulfatase n=1 Tax=Labilibaculum antarcticum TaxID=1717717 RepID=A0A1Y1CH13_9BACT|nr:sulfatase [Labilibaculum antarcticum]BAX79312.1 sulfatase [Labilibaculum antarcticum]